MGALHQRCDSTFQKDSGGHISSQICAPVHACLHATGWNADIDSRQKTGETKEKNQGHGHETMHKAVGQMNSIGGGSPAPCACKRGWVKGESGMDWMGGR